MDIKWGVQIGTNKFYGMSDFDYLTYTFVSRLTPESFTGMNMRVDLVSKLCAPNTCSFDISNGDESIAIADIEDKNACVILLLDNVLARQWCMVVETAVEAYGKISVNLVDRVTRNISGEFPNTPALSANFPSEAILSDESYRVPITFGTAFIPCAPFLSGGAKYHCLGKYAIPTINKVRSPRDWDLQSEWDNTYTYDQATLTGEQINARGVQAEIVDDDGDGTPDSYGVWTKGGRNLIPLIEFVSATGWGSITTPGSWLRNILLLFDIDTIYIDATSFGAVDTALSAVTWGGGWWSAEDREHLLSEMLSNCDCFYSIEEQVKLHQFSKTPIETLTRSQIVNLSFKPVNSTKSSVDGGTVKFAWDGEPQDILSGEATVPLYDAQATIDNPSSDVFNYRYGYDNQEAQDFGTLYFQKKYDEKHKVSFKTTLSAITNYETIVPGQVIEIDDDPIDALAIYGAKQSIVITSLTFHRDLSLSVSGTVYNNLEQYSDMTASVLTPDTDLGASFNFESLTKLVSVSGDNIFHYATGAVVPDSSPVVLTASLYGGLTTYDWEYWTGVAWANLSGTQDNSTYSLAYDNVAWAVVGGSTLRVRCKSGDYEGEITVTKMYDGAAGVAGVAGDDGAMQVFVGEYNATPTSGQFAWPKVFYNNSTRRDVIKYAGSYYTFDGTDGATISSWNASQWEAFGGSYSSVATDVLFTQALYVTEKLYFQAGAQIVIDPASDGLIVSAGGDITFQSELNNPSELHFLTENNDITIQADFFDDGLYIFPDVSGEAQFAIGYSPTGSVPFDFVFIQAESTLGLYANDSIQLISQNTLSISGDSVTIDATVTDIVMEAKDDITFETTDKGLYNYFSTNVGAVDINAVYDIALDAGRYIICESPLLFTGTNSIGNGTLDPENVFIDNDLYLGITGWANDIQLYDCTISGGLYGTLQGFIWFSVNGTTGYKIAIYK